MSLSCLQELLTFPEFEIVDHVKYLDAIGERGAHEEFVTVRREFNTLGKSADVEVIEQSCWIGLNVEHSDAVVVFSKARHDGHFSIGMKCEALHAVAPLV